MQMVEWNPSPVARKCIEEALDNAFDNYIENPDESTYCKIWFRGDTIVLENDGVRLLAVEKTEDGLNAIEAAFGHLRSGSHFDGDTPTIGQNGLGIKLANVHFF